ncbi:tetratricopeptide repeat protein [Arsenicicoccus dermatophilus]|uniref:tetratricopeptide repeat protein n=1 Tax=Arsenicicoccus dermatophilus TaxID=1076331 RepID=UPI003917609C
MRFADRDGRRSGPQDEERHSGSRLVRLEGRKLEPLIDEDVTGFELERSVKNQLRTLSKENAEGVGQHLVMAARLLGVDDDKALEHAETAVRRAGRVPAVREALGLVLYRRQEWAKALAEFRTARRLSGSHHLLPFMVDCERGLGRLDKALELATSPDAQSLPQEDRIELLIVVSGVRRDLGQLDAAKVELEVPALRHGMNRPWYARLAYAYADALLALGDEDGAVEWFHRAAQTDQEGKTDADERLADLEGFTFTDLLEGEEECEEEDGTGAREDGADHRKTPGGGTQTEAQDPRGAPAGTTEAGHGSQGREPARSDAGAGSTEEVDRGHATRDPGPGDEATGPRGGDGR